LPTARDRAILSARIASDLRGREVVVLDVRGAASWTDFMVIGTGASRRQVVAIADEIDLQLKKHGDRRIGREGYEAGNWVVLDFGDVVVHLFDDEKRAYYRLESLWEDAPRVAWEPESPPAERGETAPLGAERHPPAT
jgi:ribosome-associated protein